MSSRGWAALSCAGALGALVACAHDARAPEPLEIEIGIPDKETRRQFLPLLPGGDVFYFKGLQIEEFVMLAIRIKQTEPEAFVEVTVENVETGATASQPAVELPDPLDCTGDGWCTLAPVLLPARELGALTEINDARLKLHCKAWRDDGARGEASADGVLRPQQ